MAIIYIKYNMVKSKQGCDLGNKSSRISFIVLLHWLTSFDTGGQLHFKTYTIST